MKLSEAILLGSTMGPQIQRRMSDGKGGSCALGSALKAIGVKPWYYEGGDSVDDIWPWLRTVARCPVCDRWEFWVTFVISSHLNDLHGWTREQIAEWVASIEPQTILDKEAVHEEIGPLSAVPADVRSDVRTNLFTTH